MSPWAPHSSSLGLGRERPNQTVSPSRPAPSLQPRLRGGRTRLPPGPSAPDPSLPAAALESRPAPTPAARPQPVPAGSPGPAPPRPAPALRPALEVAAGHREAPRSGAQSWRPPPASLADPRPRPAQRPRPPPLRPPRGPSLRAPGRPAGSAPSSSRSRWAAGPGPLRPRPPQAPGKFGAGERRRQAAALMEARGELGPGRESAGGDLLLALLARREDLRRGGCASRAAAPGRADRRESRRASCLPGPGHGTRGTRQKWVRGPPRVPTGAPHLRVCRGTPGAVLPRVRRGRCPARTGSPRDPGTCLGNPLRGHSATVAPGDHGGGARPGGQHPARPSTLSREGSQVQGPPGGAAPHLSVAPSWGTGVCAPTHLSCWPALGWSSGPFCRKAPPTSCGHRSHPQGFGFWGVGAVLRGLLGWRDRGTGTAAAWQRCGRAGAEQVGEGLRPGCGGPPSPTYLFIFRRFLGGVGRGGCEEGSGGRAEAAGGGGGRRLRLGAGTERAGRREALRGPAGAEGGSPTEAGVAMQRKARAAGVVRGARRTRRARLLPDPGSGGGGAGALSGLRC